MKESKNQTPMMKQYFEIKDTHKDYILFYRMGDFYEMFFDDAKQAARALDITLTKRGKYEGKDIPMCGVPVVNHEIYLSKLIKKGFKVAFCEQMEDPAEARKRGVNSCVKREVIRLITPGTITEENILDMKMNNYLLSICMGKNKTLGVAWADMSTGRFATKKITYSYLSGLIASLEPSEVLIQESVKDEKDIKQALYINDELLSFLPDVKFNLGNAQNMLKKTFEVESLDAFGNFSEEEVIAAGVLLDYVYLTQKGKMPKISPPVQIVDGSNMEIDAATRRGLELFSPLSEGKGARSLLSILDRTITGAGGRMLVSYLANPLTDVMAINQRLDLIQFFFENTDLRRAIRKLFHNVGDMERSLSRIGLARASPRDLAVIKEGLNIVPKMSVLFDEYQSKMPVYLQDTIRQIDDHSVLVDLLTRSLSDNLPLNAKDGGFIAKGYDSVLDELRELKDESRRHIATLQNKYVKQVKIASLKICHNNILGYYIEIPSKYAQNLIEISKNTDMAFVHRQSLSVVSRFTTPELVTLEEKIRGAGDKSIAMEVEIFDYLSEQILLQADEIANTSNTIAILDVAAALAEVAENNEYVRPVVDKSYCFEIHKGRHPVVEVAFSGRRNNFVANDCQMPDSSRGNIWLITGPNMAGKSTFLRQNALIAIMAQAGMFVPAEKAHIGIIDKLFSRVGASDDLARGRSTFMVEMVETATILNRATPRSFVILDEIGRGTATFDGLAIAWSTLEYLSSNNKARTLFATHYHELTALAEKIDTLTLHTMKTREWNTNVVFLYEIIEGAADRSYGIHVAKLAGLPYKVINRASQILKELEEHQAKIDVLLGELPLFSSLNEEPTQEEIKKEESMRNSANMSVLEEELRLIDLDEITPKQALDELYKLFRLIKDDDQPL